MDRLGKTVVLIDLAADSLLAVVIHLVANLVYALFQRVVGVAVVLGELSPELDAAVHLPWLLRLFFAPL